jgi:hypothetical protein
MLHAVPEQLTSRAATSPQISALSLPKTPSVQLMPHVDTLCIARDNQGARSGQDAPGHRFVALRAVPVRAHGRLRETL